MAKRGHNHEYSYAFIDFKEDVDATPAIRKYELNNEGRIIASWVVPRYLLQSRIVTDENEDRI